MPGMSAINSESRPRVGAVGENPARASPPRDELFPSYEIAFLTQLGERVRETRGLHGMSRRELARRSGISERYVAQIEAGKGNVSIVLLLRIVHAFRCL
jgi:DNA-binding XRE family transcriptional regulator